MLFLRMIQFIFHSENWKCFSPINFPFILNFFKSIMGKKVPRKVRAKIREKARNGEKISELMKEFDLSRTTIQTILKEGNKKPKKGGRPCALTKAERRTLLRYVRENPMASAKSIAKATGLSVSKSTIQRELHRNSFHHQKVRVKHVLTSLQKFKRLEFTRSHVTWSIDEWKRVVFTDEKKWNLLGNDAYISVWSQNKFSYSQVVETNLRKGLMVWGAISCNGGLRLVCVDERINTETYIDMLQNDFFGVVKEELPSNFLFQQDNAPPHVSRVTKEYLEKEKIPVMDWPPVSPDLSPIENIWGIMSMKVYENGKQYKNVDDLWDAIVQAFHSISAEIYENLYNSLPKRMIQVLEGKGERIKC